MMTRWPGDPVTRWPGRERWPKWPIDPVTQWPSSISECNYLNPHHINLFGWKSMVNVLSVYLLPFASFWGFVIFQISTGSGFGYWGRGKPEVTSLRAAASHVVSNRSHPFSRRTAASHIWVMTATPYILVNCNLSCTVARAGFRDFGARGTFDVGAPWPP
jgi:hypothetical protein